MALTEKQRLRAEQAGYTPEQIAKFERILAMDPSTRKSAQRAVNRPNMATKAAEEFQYNPITDPRRRTLKSKAYGAWMKPATLAYKALGAYGQAKESALSSPIVGYQRAGMGLTPGSGKGESTMLDPAMPQRSMTRALNKQYSEGDRAEIATDTVDRALSLEEPTEYGDIYENAGLSPKAARTLGFATAMFEPDIGMVKAFGRSRNIPNVKAKPFQLVGNAVTNKNKKIMNKHLNYLSRQKGGNAESVNRLMNRSENVLSYAKNEDLLPEYLARTSAKAEEGFQTVLREAGDATGEVRAAFGDYHVPLRKETLSNVVQDMVRDSIAEFKTRIVRRGNARVKQKILKPNKNVRGADRVVSALKEIVQRAWRNDGQVSLRDIGFVLKGLSDIAGTPDYKSVYATANKLIRTLKDLRGTLPPTVKQRLNVVDSRYAKLKRLQKGGMKEGHSGFESLAKVPAGGTSKLTKYNKLSQSDKNMLAQVDAVLPDEYKFLTDLKDQSAAHVFSQVKPLKDTSLLGLVTLVMRPQMLPAVGLAIGGTSPRLSALGHTKLRDIRNKINKSPRTQATLRALDDFTDTQVRVGARHNDEQ